ncbi:MAG: class I SAM-dependent methyltransferase [Deltaproteobacteria bacterium]|nr:class I SAM-dependent methyltransferase [Deltaproteobacteria bacterium]
MLTVDFRKLPIGQGDLVLDAGCGEGRHAFECFRNDCSILGMDLNFQSLLKARYVLGQMKERKEGQGKVLLLRGDTLRFPFQDETFDKVICAEVIEHVADDRLGIAELGRILKTGGKIAITVPTLFTEHIYDQLSKEYYRTPGGHVRKVIPQTLARFMEESGLQVYAVGFAHAFHSPYWMLRCIFGLHQEKAVLPLIYKKFLHLSLFSRPLRLLEKLCNYFFPKSIILYAQKSSSESVVRSCK